MLASDRSTLAAAASVWLALFTVTPLTVDKTFLVLSWLLIALVAGVSLALRRAGVGARAVLAAQLVVWAGFVLALSNSLAGVGEPWYQHFVSVWASGAQHMLDQAAPMAPNDGVTLIFVFVIGLVLVATDLAVSGLRQPVWAILPPAILFSVPAIGLGTDTGVASFLCIALGYLIVLVAGGLNTTAGWTSGLSSDTVSSPAAGPVVWRAAALIGAPVLVLTILLGMLLPTFYFPGFGVGNGPGGNGPLQLADPTLDLRRNLEQPRDQKVIEYQTTKNSGVYLRMASLPQFNASGWGNVPMQLDPGQQLPQIPGLSAEPSARRVTTIKVLDFKSEYLPLPFAPRTINVRGNWAYDPQSLIVLSMAKRDRADAIRNLSYRVESSDIAPKPEDLGDAAAGTPVDSSITAVIPKDLPDSLLKLTREVTADADTPALKAAAIQEYLRGGGFTYTTEALPGSGYKALENFLLVDHKGYCEQFATAMAMMARVSGIPSRVAVGFLPGERKGDHWEVTIHNMHAWPELYFSGYGWVRFEPTPSSITGRAPAWTVPKADKPDAAASDEPSVKPTTASSAPTLRPDGGQSQQTTTVVDDTSFPWKRTLLGSGIGLVGLLVLAAPATIRVRRRSARLSPDGPVDARVEAAWEEIRDTVVDYGGSWPQGSPKTIGGEISHRLQGEDSDTMTRVATLVERSRYARSLADEDATRSLPGMAQDIRRGLAQPQSRWRRVRAVVVPKSLFQRRR
jgi:transglutaminase-like putative cysteine protease